MKISSKPKKATKTKKPAAQKPLEKGQLWKVRDEHVQIVQIGKLLAHFKRFKLTNQKASPVQLMSIVSIQSFLKENKATLIQTAPQTPPPAAKPRR